MNGPECLWRDGEHEPEGDPEELVDRVADEVEERRLQKMQALEKPDCTTKGISYLTARNVYDWRKNIPPWRWNINEEVEARSGLVAREFAFAEGKRDDILSPATSGHVLKLLPTIFLQKASEEEEAREGEGAFSQMLGCLDVKDAFLQVPQEKPLKVNLRGEEFLGKRNLPGQRVGAKAWFDFSQSTSPRNSTTSSVLSVRA